MLCAGDAYHMMAEAELHAHPPRSRDDAKNRTGERTAAGFSIPFLRGRRREGGGEQRHMSDTVADEAK